MERLVTGRERRGEERAIWLADTPSSPGSDTMPAAEVESDAALLMTCTDMESSLLWSLHGSVFQ